MNKFIYTHKNALTKHECDQIIKYFNGHDNRYQGAVGDGVQSSQKKSTDLNLSDRDCPSDILRNLDNSLSNIIREYIRVAPSIKSINSFGRSEYRLRLYTCGEHFDWHIDSFNSSVSKRILAILWYLNTPSLGGNTEFLYQEKKVLAECGAALVFPTSFEYVHRSEAVVKGEKYIALTFIEHE